MKTNISITNKFYIENILHKFGIGEDVFNVAKNMDLSLENLVYDNLVVNDSKRNEEVLISSLMGVYGNLFATKYLEGLGYETYNEVPIYDQNGKEITRADIVYKDKNGVINYCEVKTAFQIIEDSKNYIDKDDFNSIRKFYTNKKEESLKYKNIGNKLIKQVSKLKENKESKTNVIVYMGCLIDDKIISKLKEKNVSVITLGMNVIDLYEFIKTKVEQIKNTLNPKKENSYFQRLTYSY